MKYMLDCDENDELFIGDTLLRYFGNCLDCGICCKIFNSIDIADEEIETISRSLKMTQKDFLTQYTKKNKKHNALATWSLKTPCPFQDSTRCTIQKTKPFDCRTFPLLINLSTKKAILSGIYLCPQATHFYQGFLEYCSSQFPTLYKTLIVLEDKSPWTPLGLELTLSSTPLEMYIDWLSTNDNKKKK